MLYPGEGQAMQSRVAKCRQLIRLCSFDDTHLDVQETDYLNEQLDQVLLDLANLERWIEHNTIIDIVE